MWNVQDSFYNIQYFLIWTHVQDCFVRFAHLKKDRYTDMKHTWMMMGPQESENKDCYLKKKWEASPGIPIYGRKGGCCSQCCKYCKITVYHVCHGQNLDVISVCFFFCGGVWWAFHIQRYTVVFIMFFASKIGNGYGKQSPKDAEGGGR